MFRKRKAEATAKKPDLKISRSFDRGEYSIRVSHYTKTYHYGDSWWEWDKVVAFSNKDQQLVEHLFEVWCQEFSEACEYIRAVKEGYDKVEYL